MIRKLIIAVLSVLLPVCCTAAAQDVSQERLAECAAKATADERLACYEALTIIPDPAGGKPVAESPESVQRVPQEAESPAPGNAVVEISVEQGARREIVTETDPAMPMEIAAEPVAESLAAPEYPTPETEAAAPAAVPDGSRSSVPDDLGTEHLDRNSAKTEPSTMTTTVSDVKKSHSGRLYFYFSNGQVWQQIEPRRFRYPKDREFEVMISQGMMGEYRLRVGGEGPMTRIRRVE